MKTIRYYSTEDDRMLLIPVDDFVSKEAWNLPYDFVLEQADQNVEIQSALYHQLLRRSKKESDIEKLKNSKYYKKLYTNVVNGSNELEKMMLSIYFDPSLIPFLFQDMNQLVSKIINHSTSDVFPTELLDMLVKVSEFDLEDSTKEMIHQGVSSLVDKEFSMMDEYDPYSTISSKHIDMMKDKMKRHYLGKMISMKQK